MDLKENPNRGYKFDNLPSVVPSKILWFLLNHAICVQESPILPRNFRKTPSEPEKNRTNVIESADLKKYDKSNT